MAKTLELMFGTEFGKTARIAVDNPKEPVDEAGYCQTSDGTDHCCGCIYISQRQICCCKMR